MNKHPKEVSSYMKNINVTSKPTKAIMMVKFEDKYGDEKIIHLTRSGLRVKRTKNTVSLALNAKAAELTSKNIKRKRQELGLTLEDVIIKAGIVSTTPKSRMWEIENNTAKGGMRLGTLYALAIALNCTPQDLLPSMENVIAESGVEITQQATVKI